MEFAIRPYHPSDLYSLYHMCHLTGIGPNDAGRDPELLGHFYAAPYAVFEPELCFILTADHRPCGYTLGTRDSQVFAQRCEQEWFPILRKRYPLPAENDKSPGAGIIRRFHAGYKLGPVAQEYPAHMHIDLLPEAQGQKLGHKMMKAFLDKLIALGVTGLHLGTNTGNARAVAFYDRLGFSRYQEVGTSIIFAMRLAPKA